MEIAVHFAQLLVGDEVVLEMSEIIGHLKIAMFQAYDIFVR